VNMVMKFLVQEKKGREFLDQFNNHKHFNDSGPLSSLVKMFHHPVENVIEA
jgi:hypothetical protein